MSNVSTRHINTKHLLEYNTQKCPSKQSAFGSVCYWVVTLDVSFTITRVCTLLLYACFCFPSASSQIRLAGCHFHQHSVLTVLYLTEEFLQIAWLRAGASLTASVLPYREAAT